MLQCMRRGGNAEGGTMDKEGVQVSTNNRLSLRLVEYHYATDMYQISRKEKKRKETEQEQDRFAGNR